MEKKYIENAKHFEYGFISSGNIKKIKWEILGDTEYITDYNLVGFTDYYGK